MQLIRITTERLMDEWVSPIYAFFDPTPHIVETDRQQAHKFKCCAKACKASIRHFLDKKNARSTGNMRKHVKSCWGEEILSVADDTKDAKEVRTKIVGSILKNGTITASFERKGKGKLTYSHHQHTWAETKAEIVQWVSESLRLFEIVKDRGFQTLMKTGRPGYYLPSPSTVSRNVRLVFAKTRQRVARMLQEYNSKINFTMDGWSSPNHRAFVAFRMLTKP
ncbi:hypothetical protein DFH29DRAFT_803739 [Suillus ampliporus]|nr:hypothetical protein DFH29DRAFT_803739 [Suillus ampliporus]